ncbi:hypothetical protein K470DRAFT_260631 [Piedraia hortae CBS 480.64]|uniref:Protein kinase domain-containing protein n=1 Tax=Piedraia hortae CBS 480.64 TaxID=1314780 RepID=A0A6A7BSV9_9PEZI|nr:hypothetical protein K470DRAFT_260631 [Piedraia hortae CBS 480.64]
MGTRTYAEVAPTSTTMALNASIFGYSGHSLVTPHAALKPVWWTDRRINEKVTESFIASKLQPTERPFLYRSVHFGESLTDDTYLDWIIDRAKRLFLILNHIGVPEQIFGCIDQSWDDQDLPIPREAIKTMDLSYVPDETLDSEFYKTQFLYLLRELESGAHIDYGPNEHIPMDHVNTAPPATALQVHDRVQVPGRPEIYQRRRYSISDNGRRRRESETSKALFLREVRRAQAIEHEHICPIWATYTSSESAYTLSPFVAEHTLESFMTARVPIQFKRVATAKRPHVLCEWMHCLADTLAYLHHNKVGHTPICSSQIVICKDNHIAFADAGGCFEKFALPHMRNREKYEKEKLIYAAPEVPSGNTITRKASFNTISSERPMSQGDGRSLTPSTSPSSFNLKGIFPRKKRNSASRNSHSPIIAPSLSFFSRSPPPQNMLSRLPASPPQSPTFPPISPSRIQFPFPPDGAGSVTATAALQSLKRSEVFSLGCIFLEIATLIIRGKINDLAKFRAAHSPNGTTATYHAIPPGKLAAWIEGLKADSSKQRIPVEGNVFAALPGILDLIQKMLALNPAGRPDAAFVRDGIKIALRASGSSTPLCCERKTWVKREKPLPVIGEKLKQRGQVRGNVNVGLKWQIQPQRFDGVVQNEWWAEQDGGWI